MHTNGAPTHGAPLVYSNGAPHVWCAISVNSIYSPFPSSVKIIKVKPNHIIKVDEGTVEVLDSLLKKARDYSIAKGVVNR